MLKTKILKLLPYWLSVLLALIGLQCLGLALGRSNVPPQNLASTSQPEVLGAFTDVRGQNSVSLIPPLIQKRPLHLVDNQLSAKSYLVYDLDSGEILAQKDSRQKLPIASLTKLLTALIAYEKLDLTSTLTIQPADIMRVQPVLGLKQGDVVKVQDLLNAMLVGSCNDAALTLANHVASQQNADFVLLMNQKAQSLGMSDSLFSNPLGFDLKQNYSTAADLKKLVDAVEHLSVFRSLSKLVSYNFVGSAGKVYQAKATNKLVAKYPDLEAVKTGYTETAQGAMISKLDINGHQLILMVIGSQDREQDTLELRQQLLASYN